MRVLTILTFALLLVCASSVVALADQKIPNETPSFAQPTICPVDLYKGMKEDGFWPIPDNDPNGMLLGPIVFPPDPGFVIVDVVVDLEIEHTWVGDLIVTLSKTDATGATKSVDLIQRPGVPETTFGCSGDLLPGDKYWFGIGGGKPLGEFDCPPIIPWGCYTEAVENPGGLAQFQDQTKEGEWWLFVSDNAAGDTGIVFNWSVHILNESIVSVESSSWARIKATYR